MIPEGVKVYGQGRIRAKAGQELPQALKAVKGIDERIKRAGENFEKRKPKKKAEIKPVENKSFIEDKK